MALLKVTPTRMNLSALKTRLATSTRGHKLLKDKQDELMRRFIETVRHNKTLREEVEEELSKSFKDFLLASALMSPEMLKEAVSMPTQETFVDITKKNVMSVEIPIMEFETKKLTEGGSIYPYGFTETTADLDMAVEKLNRVMSKLLELAQVEKSAQLMADEIEKTRRRVNALEYRTIPDLEETIKFIRQKLDENERANITRLMKVKDIISKEENKPPKIEFEVDELEVKM
ncbi:MULTISPECIES: V-type ATP synthase subunit D [Peptoniphilus]|uniref:V-type ATP synthase subunit D n=1 Tax=Peptoniphilus duerdenii ATCC BAA-1640 TaxID=862517 RepID=E0NP60_9FIRM|nr:MULTISPECIES: V-type ATP synthase subunit D [Peptoniphilus]EFM24528.1 V-type ATPase, D subunit [Peptoniphilus duerdenii ATCC BAA-1640]ERT63510.1 V-type sodium ATPase, D subunit [Peptoniphilus sp. BV3AC2]MDK8275494.1 V-type ATP synthase subunit D [Peptoniphilus duerdenii]